MAVKNNLGRMTNILSGWQGVAAGATATLNIGVNGRYHRNLIRPVAVNYTAPTLTLKNGGGTNATFTPTVVNGQITGWTVGGTNTGYTNGTYSTAAGTLIITDATGIGAAGQIVVSGGVCGPVTNVGGGTYTAAASGGLPGPIDPRVFFTNFKQIVNSQVINDLSPTMTMAILNHKGIVPQYGMFPLYMTQPKRNWLRDSELNSWDVAGQQNFIYQAQIASGMVSPGIYSFCEWDTIRNARTVTAANQKYLGNAAIGTQVPFLAPINGHQINANVTAGQYDITNLPITYPISAIYLIGATPGNIWGIDLIVDGQLRYQATVDAMYELNGGYELQTGSPVYAPYSPGNGCYGYNSQSLPSGNALTGSQGQVPTTVPNGPLTLNYQGNSSSPYAFDAVFVADINGRPWNALNVNTSLTVRVHSNISQTVTVAVEALPGAFLG